jgi:hypothetical protein
MSIENVAAMSALLNWNSSIAALAMPGANAAAATTAAASNVLFILHPLDERSERSRGFDKGAIGDALARCGQSSAFLRQLGIDEPNQTLIHAGGADSA